MMDKKNKKFDKDKDAQESLNPETIKGPQKDEHTNQYGDKDEDTRVQ